MNAQHLNSICLHHPHYVPVEVAADFLHIRPANLRACIDQGRCPFGFSWTVGERSGYKIPTLAFFAWLTKGIAPIVNQ